MNADARWYTLMVEIRASEPAFGLEVAQGLLRWLGQGYCPKGATRSYCRRTCRDTARACRARLESR